MRDMKRILISGEGGQGIQLISKCLVKAAYYSGKKISYVPNYGVEQRGGVSLGFVQISNEEIGFPKFQNSDIMVILAERAIERVTEYITPDTTVVYDASLVSEEKLAQFKNKKVQVKAHEIAEKELTLKVFNMIVLGFLAKMAGGITVENLKKAVEEELGDKFAKKPELKHLNEKALEIGLAEREEALV